MTSTLVRTAPAATRRRLPDGLAFVLLASVIVFFLAASSAPTPLYGTYQQMWHFSPIMTTVVFGTYAIAVLIALLIVGRLSDHVGRRPVLLAAIAVQLPTMALLASADGVGDLLVARVLQGIATGAAAGAVGAGLLDLNASRGTLANSVAIPIGTASGALVAGLFVQFLPAPTHLIYLVLAGIFALQFLGILAMRETVNPKAGAVASLRPAFGVPARMRGAVFVAVPALLAGFSLAGLYGSLGPALVRDLSGSDSLLLGGIPLFVAAGSGAVMIAIGQRFRPHGLMRYATLSLITGVGVTLIGVQWSNVWLFLVGSAVAGTGFGASFQAAIRTVVPLAEAHERAGVLSVLYTVSYLAMGLPAVVAGWLVVNEGGLLTTAREFAAFVIVLAGAALAGLVRHERRIAVIA